MPDRIHQLLEEIVHAITRFLKEHAGQGPQGYRTYVIDDMIVIRLFKTLTSVESEMAKTAEGRRSVKYTRGRLIGELGRSWKI